MTPSKECVTCDNLSCINIAEGINVYPCTICCRIGNSKDIDKWAPRETKKMKSTPNRIIEALKEMFTFSNSVSLFAARITSIVIFLFLLYDGIKSVGDEPSGDPLTGQDIFFVFMILIGIWLLGYFARRPHPNEKPLIIWLKICILKVQIWHKQAYLYFYPDLKKYRGNPKRKAKVWAKRDRLKELKRELKELV